MMNPEDYRVVIASYRRATLLTEKTMAMLSRHSIDPSRVSVIVANEEERISYSSTLPAKSYSELLVAVPGRRECRNWVREHFEDGELLWCLDDDVKELWQRVGDKEKRPVPDLHDFVVDAFRTAQQEGLGLWGIYPVMNPFFMQDGYSKDLRLIVGHCFGVENRRGAAFALGVGEKEDYERAIQYYLADGGVLRFNGVASETKCYDVPGGMDAPDRKERQEEAVRYLLEKYPGLCLRTQPRKAGYPEIRLRDARLPEPKRGFF